MGLLNNNSKIVSALVSLLLSIKVFATPHVTPPNRVASIYVSEDFVNEQMAQHSKSALLKEMKVAFDTKNSVILLRGRIQVPVEELRAIGLDPTLGAFHFQVTIKPEITKKGYLILDFPLSETYFYPVSSTDPVHDRVIIPVQLLSLVIASARGYFAALSGDFSGFDKRTQLLSSQIKTLDHSISVEKNAEARETLQNEKAGLKLQLAAVPIERKQLQSVAKEFEHVLGFTGEKELNINEDLGARKNALILKLKLSQLAPYLTGVDLGGVRLLLDKKDGDGQNYLAIDVNSQLVTTPETTSPVTPAPRERMKVAPSLIMRLNESLLESKAVAEAEKKSLGDKVHDLKLHLKDDGLHVTGSAHAFLFFSVSFETVVDFVTTAVDTFEVRVRRIEVAGINVEFLAKVVLESVKQRLDSTLKGVCTFDYVGEEKDHSRALQVKVNTKTLVPAFPDLHLVNVDVRDKEFLLKIGHLQPSAVSSTQPLSLRK